MLFLKNLLDKQTERMKNGKLARLLPLHEALDSFLFTEAKNTTGATHVRDGVDTKRVMMTVVFALVPCILMAMYNTGLQSNLALEPGAQALDDWRYSVTAMLGLGHNPQSVLDCFVLGATYYLPILIVTFAAGGAWEVLFAVIRRHEINEGFLVTGMLFPLVLPATIPLWQVALGISFGVVLGKEVFGGTGYNIFNPALTARAFLFFGYPAQISGDDVWIAVDATSGATPLAKSSVTGVEALGGQAQWMDAFLGFIPGSIGETSTLACLFGAFVLLLTGMASWRIILSVVVGVMATASLLNFIGSDTNPMFQVPFWWHFVLGGMAFATVFMATDPVTAPYSLKGQLIYGFLIGVLIVVIRVLNPAYPEGLLVAILFMNMFSPLIDHYIVEAHKKRRRARYAA